MRRALPLALLLAACLGTSPEDAEREALGPYGDDDDGDPEHRPGQPCLVCHDEFVVAGTVFLYADDDVGVGGAVVEVEDAEGRIFSAPTNRTGNFMVSVKGGISAPQLSRRGNLLIPWDPVFPLRVNVRRNGVERDMESWIWREGACAGCHVGSADTAESVARVYLLEPGEVP